MLVNTLFFAIDIDQAPPPSPPSEIHPALPPTLYAFGRDGYVYTAPLKQDTTSVQFTKCKTIVASDVNLNSGYGPAGIYAYQNIIYVRTVLKRDSSTRHHAIIRSTDQGNTWTIKKEVPTLAYHFYISKKTGYLYQPDSGQIFVSRDQGDSWDTYKDPAIDFYSRIIGSNEPSVLVKPNSVLAAFTASKDNTPDVRALYFTLESDIQFQLLELPHLSNSDGYGRFAINDIIFDEYEQIVYVFSSIQKPDGTQGNGIIIDYFKYIISKDDKFDKLILPKSEDIKSIIRPDGPTILPIQYKIAPDVIAGFKLLFTQVGIIDMLNSPDVSFQMYNLDGEGNFEAQKNTQTSFTPLIAGTKAWSALKTYQANSNIYYAFLDGNGIVQITSNGLDTEHLYKPWVILNGTEGTTR